MGAPSVDTPDVVIQEADFDTRELQQTLQGNNCDAGAVASSVGLVRAGNEGREISQMELEHYPGMTELIFQAIVDEARQRWELQEARVVHRVGKLRPGEQIVYVGVSSAHRRAAFEACEFIMDYLKTQAPFWKKETSAEGDNWVDARDSDTRAAERWVASPK